MFKIVLANLLLVASTTAKTYDDANDGLDSRSLSNSYGGLYPSTSYSRSSPRAGSYENDYGDDLLRFGSSLHSSPFRSFGRSNYNPFSFRSSNLNLFRNGFDSDILDDVSDEASYGSILHRNGFGPYGNGLLGRKYGSGSLRGFGGLRGLGNGFEGFGNYGHELLGGLGGYGSGLGYNVLDRFGNDFSRGLGGYGSRFNGYKKGLHGYGSGLGALGLFGRSDFGPFSNGLGRTTIDGSVSAILKDYREEPLDGSYSFAYKTEDGTRREEAGSPLGPNGAVVKEGSYSFTYPDGTPAHFRYVADENGFRVDSNVLPQTPEHSLAQVTKAEREKAAGILHDGQYSSEDHFGTSDLSRTPSILGGFGLRPGIPLHSLAGRSSPLSHSPRELRDAGKGKKQGQGLPQIGLFGETNAHVRGKSISDRSSEEGQKFFPNEKANRKGIESGHRR